MKGGFGGKTARNNGLRATQNTEKGPRNRANITPFKQKRRKAGRS